MIQFAFRSAASSHERTWRAGHAVNAGRALGLGMGHRLARIGYSWMALKTWVKVWLFFLNAVLFAAFAFTPDPLALATLASLPVTFVLLMVFALRMGGLNRLMGIGHLIPWLPLLAYLELRLVSDIAGPRIDPVSEPALFAWALVLGASLGYRPAHNDRASAGRRRGSRLHRARSPDGRAYQLTSRVGT